MNPLSPSGLSLTQNSPPEVSRGPSRPGLGRAWPTLKISRKIEIFLDFSRAKNRSISALEKSRKISKKRQKPAESRPAPPRAPGTLEGRKRPFFEEPFLIPFDLGDPFRGLLSVKWPGPSLEAPEKRASHEPLFTEGRPLNRPLRHGAAPQFCPEPPNLAPNLSLVHIWTAPKKRAQKSAKKSIFGRERQKSTLKKSRK